MAVAEGAEQGEAIAGVTPAVSARSAAAWITGPSAIGSEKGMPSSSMSAPPSTSCVEDRGAGLEIRIAEHDEGAEHALSPDANIAA